MTASYDAPLRGYLPWQTGAPGTLPGGYRYRGQGDLVELNRRIMAGRTAASRFPVETHAGHGTNARARKHRRDGEKPCPSCLEAEARFRTPNPQGRKSRQAW